MMPARNAVNNIIGRKERPVPLPTPNYRLLNLVPATGSPVEHRSLPVMSANCQHVDVQLGQR
jgi:hypothetical protein